MELGPEHLGGHAAVSWSQPQRIGIWPVARAMKLIAVFLLWTTVTWASAQTQNVKAVYHVTTGVETAAAVLNNVMNHLNADPAARLVVVANGPGIDFMLQDAKDSRGREFSAAVSTLSGRGVEFRVCNNTLNTRNLRADQLLMEARVVPSGVAEAANLQFRQGFAYIKP